MENGTKICPQCGKSVWAGAKFCGKCGIVLSGAEAAQSGNQPASHTEGRPERKPYKPKPEKAGRGRRFAVLVGAVAILYLIGLFVSGDLERLLEDTGLIKDTDYIAADHLLYPDNASSNSLKTDNGVDGSEEDSLENISSETALMPVEMKINNIEGDFISGRTLVINAQGLGSYDANACKAAISGKPAQIYSWADHLITLLVPPELEGGEHEITITGTKGSKIIRQKFTAHGFSIVAEGNIVKGQDNIIQGDIFKLFVPAASVLTEQKITIKRLSPPASDQSSMTENILQYEITGDDGSRLEFGEPVILTIDMSAVDLKSLGSEGGRNLTSYTYDDWQGRWFQQNTFYDEDKKLLHIKTDHFSPGTVSAPKSVSKSIEGKYCKVYYKSNEQAKSINSIKAAYPDSDTAAAEVAGMFDKSYEAYVNVFGKDNSPDFKLSEKQWNKSTWTNYFTALSTKRKTVKEDNRAIIEVTASADKSGAYQKSITGKIVLPVSYDTAGQMENMVAHELFHIFQAVNYGNIKKLISASMYKDMAEWTASKLGYSNFFINSGFLMDATAEYAANVIARGEKVMLERYDDTRISKPFFQYEQKNSNSHEYGMSAFIQYIVDKNVISGGGSKEAAFKKFWLDFVREAGYKSNVVPALDKVVNNMTGAKNTQKAYEDFWTAVLTDSDAPNFNNNNGVQIIRHPTDGKTIQIYALEGGYSGASVTFRKKEYQIQYPEIKIQSLWFKKPNDPALYCDIYRLDGSPMDNFRLKKQLAGVARFDYLGNRKEGIDKPLIYDLSQDSYGIRIFTSHSSLKKFDTEIEILASNIIWTNEKELMKYYGSNYTVRTEKEFLFRLEGFHKQYSGAEALKAEIDWGDGNGSSKIGNLTANSEIKIKHAYSPDDISAGLPKITLSIMDARGNVLHRYEKGVSPATLHFNASTYTGKTAEDISFSVSGLRHPKNCKFVWKFGDSQKAETTVVNTSHNYSKAGKYTATVELYDMDSRDTKPVASASAKVEVSDEQTPAPQTATAAPSATPAQGGGHWALKERITTDKAELEKFIEDQKPWGYDCSISVNGNTATTFQKFKNSGGSTIVHSFEEPPKTLLPGQVLKSKLSAELSKADAGAPVLANTSVYCYINGDSDNYLSENSASIDNQEEGGKLNDSNSVATVTINIPGKANTLHLDFVIENRIYYDVEYVYEWVE